ncbi:MAG: Hsp20/alpha crystallin family protein [Candidatus Omnitrophica bacterium]|nr:Hsp20/alpha crystallin family protein [Candidatus Omnitrophota bacterium]
MALIRWQERELDPFYELLDWKKNFLDIFNTSIENLSSRFLREMSWKPSLDVSEDKDSLNIKVDLPGIRQQDIDVSISGNVLTIKGERKKEQETKEKNYHKLERFYGSFARSLTLPNYVDVNKVKASYKDGVLEITFPKTETAKAKQIKVDIK